MRKYNVLWMLILISFFLTACSQDDSSNHEDAENEPEMNVVEHKREVEKGREVDKDTDVENIPDLEGIEEVYDLTFEKVKTPEKTFEEFAVLEKGEIEEIIMEKVFDQYTFMIYMKKNQPEGYEHFFFVGFMIKSKESNVYEIGEIGYGPNVESLNPYTMDKVSLFNKEYLRIRGICGANCPITYYMDIYHGKKPSIFLGMHAVGLEKDINGDGVNELVATVGTKVDTTIYLEENEQVIKAELFAISDTIQVFHSEGNVFHIFFENRKLARYQYEDRQLHFVEFTD